MTIPNSFLSPDIEEKRRAALAAGLCADALGLRRHYVRQRVPLHKKRIEDGCRIWAMEDVRRLRHRIISKCAF